MLSAVSIFAQVIFLFVDVVVVIWMCLILISSILSSIHGAPYVPMKGYLVRQLLEFGGLSSADVFYDLGCGDGRVLISAGQDFHMQEAHGYEAAPWSYLKCTYRIRRSGLQNITVQRQNFFNIDLSRATFVYLYLFPKIVDRLAYKLEKELKNGTIVLCPSFPIDLNKHSGFKLKKETQIGSVTAYLYETV